VERNFAAKGFLVLGCTHLTPRAALSWHLSPPGSKCPPGKGNLRDTTHLVARSRFEGCIPRGVLSEPFLRG
jgi:hypothetical protein